MAQKSISFPVFLVFVGYLVFAALAGWWPWNVKVATNPVATPTPTVTPTITPTLTPEPINIIPDDQYAIRCQEGVYEETEVFKGQPWYEYLKGRILPGWYMTSVCYNAELNSAVYFRSQINPDAKPDPDLDYYSQFGIYDVSKDDFIVGPKYKVQLFVGCGPVDAWMRTGQIIYSCGGGDGGFSYLETYSFDPKTKNQKLIRRCTTEIGVENDLGAKEECVDNPKN